jgi:hypothetical protein
MLMLKNKAARLMAVGLVLAVAFAACKDDDKTTPSLRSKTFNLTVSSSSASQAGTVKLSENTDSSVNLTVTLTKTTSGVKSPLYLIGGTVAAPLTDTLMIDTIAGTGNAVTQTLWNKIKTVTVNGQQRKFNYDSAMALPAFAKISYSATKDSVVAIGNILKSGK